MKIVKVLPVIAAVAAAFAVGGVHAFEPPERDLQDEPWSNVGRNQLGCCGDGECAEGEECEGSCCIGCWPIMLGNCVVPSPSPTPVICFSADATVQVKDKGRVAMKDLTVGDHVVTGDATNKYEPVYAFAHSMPDQQDDFVRIESSPTSFNNEKPIELSPDHLIKVEGRFVKARSVRVGDSLEGYHHVPVKVEKVHSVTKSGLFAPLTPSGTILVDGVVASSYVSMQAKGDEYPLFANGMILPISQHFGIHMWLTPLRFLCLGVSATFCNVRNEDGMVFWADWGIRLATFADEQNMLVQFLLLVIALVLVPPIYALECLVGPKYAPLVILGAMLTGVGLKKKTMMMTGRLHFTNKKTEKKKD